MDKKVYSSTYLVFDLHQNYHDPLFLGFENVSVWEHV